MKTLGMALFLFALGCCVSHLAGCTPAQQLSVENAAAVAQYDRQLVACKEQGKAAKDMDVFLRCEEDLSRQLCRGSAGLRKEWARCKEVLP